VSSINPHILFAIKGATNIAILYFDLKWNQGGDFKNFFSGSVKKKILKYYLDGMENLTLEQRSCNP
jgi:hypothetical protein